MTSKQKLMEITGVNPDTLNEWKKIYQNKVKTSAYKSYNQIDNLKWSIPKKHWHLMNTTTINLFIEYFENVRQKAPKMKKAYILSFEHGTVQIGDTVFQPCTGNSFKSDRKGLRDKPYEMVMKKSMTCAQEALYLAELPF